MVGGLQVEKQEKACRRELERALTRAAMEQDLAAIDQAESVMAVREHKLERLLTQKNLFAQPLVGAAAAYAWCEHVCVKTWQCLLVCT